MNVLDCGIRFVIRRLVYYKQFGAKVIYFFLVRRKSLSDTVIARLSRNDDGQTPAQAAPLRPLRFKALCGTASVMGKRVIYPRAGDLLVPRVDHLI